MQAAIRSFFWSLRVGKLPKRYVFYLTFASMGLVAGGFSMMKDSLTFIAGTSDEIKNIALWIELGTILLIGVVIGPYLPKLGYQKVLLWSISFLLSGLLIIFTLTYLSNHDVQIHQRLMDYAYMGYALFFGISFGCSYVISYSSVGLLVKSKKQHTSATCIMEGFFILGCCLSIPLFGYFMLKLMLEWYWVLLIVGMSLIPTWILVYFARFDEPNLTPRLNSQNLEYLKDSALMSRNSLILILMISVIIYYFLSEHLNQWLKVYGGLNLFGQESSYALLAASFGFMAVSRFISGFLVFYISPVVLFSISIFSFSGFIMSSMYFHLHGLSIIEIYGWELQSDLVFIPMMGFSLGPTLPILQSIILREVKNIHQNIAISLIIFAMILGQFVMPYASQVIFKHMNPETAFILILLPSAVIYVFFLLLFNDLKESTSS